MNFLLDRATVVVVVDRMGEPPEAISLEVSGRRRMATRTCEVVIVFAECLYRFWADGC